MGKDKLWGYMREKVALYQKEKIMYIFIVLPPKTVHRGLKFPLYRITNSTIFHLLTINDAQSLMSKKYKPLLQYKLHPNV